jgi:prophage regulatory protein
MSERILREPEVRTMTGLSRTTRWRLERAGQFPPKRQISAGAVGWLESEILAWMNQGYDGARVASARGRLAA